MLLDWLMKGGNNYYLSAMDRQKKVQLRSELFRHLDGIVTIPTAYLLHTSGILEYILKNQSTTLDSLVEKFNANDGYLNVALRVLASQGWLEYSVKSDVITVSINDRSKIAFGLIPHYADAAELINVSGHFHPRKFEDEPFKYLERLFQNYTNKYGMEISENSIESEIQNQILCHIEGIIVGPSIVSLGMGGMFHMYFMKASFRPDEFHNNGKNFDRLLDIFSYLGWFEKKNDTYSFTEKGLFFARRASAYGVTVSYIPAFRKLNELLFGDPTIFWNLPKGANEIHVDREMNVWGSGGAHSTYFKKIDEIIIDIFNKPIDEQPKGIVDMGCGNGAFLIHLFDVIEKRTLRGEMLEEYPLFLVGADYNKAALDVTRSNIVMANIWAKVIWGDIGRPDLLADNLQENYGINLGELLNVRTFLDHNRIWSDPTVVANDEESTSSGAFAFRGKKLSNELVEANLKEHFSKWAPYVQKYGLLVIELHTIDPSITARNLGTTAATAYDATHGFSDQYIVEVDIFNKVASRAGLFPVEEYFTKFPDSELATVSINLLKAKK